MQLYFWAAHKIGVEQMQATGKRWAVFDVYVICVWDVSLAGNLLWNHRMKRKQNTEIAFHCSTARCDWCCYCCCRVQTAHGINLIQQLMCTTRVATRCSNETNTLLYDVFTFCVYECLQFFLTLSAPLQPKGIYKQNKKTRTFLP